MTQNRIGMCILSRLKVCADLDTHTNIQVDECRRDSERGTPRPSVFLRQVCALDHHDKYHPLPSLGPGCCCKNVDDALCHDLQLSHDPLRIRRRISPPRGNRFVVCPEVSDLKGAEHPFPLCPWHPGQHKSRHSLFCIFPNGSFLKLCHIL